jgi:hypothetical protein
MNDKDKKTLERIKSGLNPPTEEEVNKAQAKWLFGNKADKMLKYAPWSFVLTKLMWRKGEEPWKA